MFNIMSPSRTRQTISISIPKENSVAILDYYASLLSSAFLAVLSIYIFLSASLIASVAVRCGILSEVVPTEKPTVIFERFLHLIL